MLIWPLISKVDVYLGSTNWGCLNQMAHYLAKGYLKQKNLKGFNH
jgi:hypothetical protein